MIKFKMSMSNLGKHKLSRLSITGDIGPDTPLCVLSEIAKAHRIRMDLDSVDDRGQKRGLIALINSREVPLISEPYGKADIRRIATYVNRSFKWPRRDLINAYDFMNRFMSGSDMDEISIHAYRIGEQTPSWVQSINSCCLYALCKRRRIRTDCFMSPEDMTRLLAIYESPIENITTYLLRSVYHSRYKSDMVNAISALRGFSAFRLDETDAIATLNDPNMANLEGRDMESDGATDTASCIDDLEMFPDNLGWLSITDIKRPIKITEGVYDELSRLGYALRSGESINPTTDIEAIAVACVEYNIDTSASVDPMAELGSIESRGGYRPVCQNICSRIMDPHMGIYLNLFFNPLLPVSLYSEEQLRSHALNEGYAGRDMIETHPYTLLQTASVCNTFYHGKSIDHTNDTTSILCERVDTISSYESVSYGLRLSPKHVFTYSELRETFGAYMCFSDPSSRDPRAMFSDISISKLLILARIKRRPGESEDQYLARYRLAGTISRVREHLSELTHHEIVLKRIYESGTSRDREQIYDILRCLLHLSMYMRGWNGLDEFPISIALVASQVMVDLNVTRAIAELDSLCASDMGSTILSLPLVNYNRFSREYYRSVDEEMGITIKSRLDIVREGQSQHSCIRLSSNWLAASVHKYMAMLSMDPPFSIDSMADIS